MCFVHVVPVGKCDDRTTGENNWGTGNTRTSQRSTVDVTAAAEKRMTTSDFLIFRYYTGTKMFNANWFSDLKHLPLVFFLQHSNVWFIIMLCGAGLRSVHFQIQLSLLFIKLMDFHLKFQMNIECKNDLNVTDSKHLHNSLLNSYRLYVNYISRRKKKKKIVILQWAVTKVSFSLYRGCAHMQYYFLYQKNPQCPILSPKQKQCMHFFFDNYANFHLFKLLLCCCHDVMLSAHPL